MAKFILNDESKTNSYGVRVLNTGIDLTRFLQNPVMLDEHVNSTSKVIGRWKNISISGNKLIAESEFDNGDEASRIIAGKVERGFIKGASMGIRFNQSDLQTGKDGVTELVKCQLMEASICAIPSNENTISFFAQDGHKLTEKEAKHQFLSFKKLNTINMNFVKKLIEILGLDNDATEEDIITEVEKIIANQKEETNKKIEQMLNLAMTEYNLDATEKDFWTDVALKDFDKVEKILLAPNKKRIYLSRMIQNPNSGGTVENRTSWTLDDYRKKDPKALESNPELFMKLYEKEVKQKV